MDFIGNSGQKYCQNGLVYLILLEIIVFLIGDGSWKKKLFITLAFSVVITVLEILLINVVIIFEICDLNLISNDIKISSLILILTQMLAFIFFHVIICTSRYSGTNQYVRLNIIHCNVFYLWLMTTY